MGEVIQVAGTSAGGNENALASFDVPVDSTIVGVDWSGFCAFDTTADFNYWQLAFGNTLNTANDARSIISMFNMGRMIVLTAVGAVLGAGNHYVSLPAIRVSAGERIFLHASSSAATVATVFALVHFSASSARPGSRRLV